MSIETKSIGHQAEHGSNPAIIETVRLGDPGFQEWVRLRESHGERAGWDREKIGKEGNDEYDRNPTTVHLVAQRYGTMEIIAGVRFTPIGDVTSSLSWSMLSGEMRTQAIASLEQNSTPHENRWDLTRLVTIDVQPGDLGTQMLVNEAIIALLGAGTAITKKYGDMGELEPEWWFTTTVSFKDWAGRTGLQFHGVAQDDFSNIVSCYARPAEDYRHLEQATVPTVYHAARRGMLRAAELLARTESVA